MNLTGWRVTRYLRAMGKRPAGALRRVIEHLGGQIATGAALGVTQGTVSYWLNVKGKVPAEYVLAAEAATGRLVRRWELRPDIYPTPLKRRPLGKDQVAKRAPGG